jgi:isopentenyldiphosphate isomerase
MEYLPLVNSRGEYVGKASRSQCHGNPDLIHPVVHLHIMNSAHEIFLQKRSLNKDLFPGFWDSSVGGHIGFGEEVRQALIRESKEEVGVDAGEARFLYKYIMKNQYESEYVYSFLLHWDGPLQINSKELAEGKFFSKDEIQRKLGTSFFTLEKTIIHGDGFFFRPASLWDAPPQIISKADDLLTPNFEEEFRRLITIEGIF